MQSLNAAVAERSQYSRRKASELIKAGRVQINGAVAMLGAKVDKKDEIKIDGEVLAPVTLKYFAFNKPVGYECSKNPEGKNPSMYQLLPKELQNLNYVGRLDVDSHGLVLLTNDGQWLQQLTHPKYEIKRVYEVELHKALSEDDQKKIIDGINLKDGISKLGLSGSGKKWTIEMRQGKNRQIRRTFAHTGYEVLDLKRTQHGNYDLEGIEERNYKEVNK
ncbi:TPA: rRNA pseudouridine synthase [Candidatus Saccharibacteria bacterium]|nr:rRNA pseudouridine synthase [Candidatus Saccharibacteria bacterium]HIO87593.1 rRNA pseudouridine synthase [Candidatus Saccharibacteria bacterium]